MKVEWTGPNIAVRSMVALSLTVSTWIIRPPPSPLLFTCPLPPLSPISTELRRFTTRCEVHSKSDAGTIALQCDTTPIERNT